MIFKKFFQNILVDAFPDGAVYRFLQGHLLCVLPDLIGVDRVLPKRPACFLQFLVIFSGNIQYGSF